MSGFHRKRRLFPVGMAMALAVGLIALSSYQADAVVDSDASRSIEESLSIEESEKASLLALMESSPEEGLECLTEENVSEPIPSKETEESGLEAESGEVQTESSSDGSTGATVEASGSEADSAESSEESSSGEGSSSSEEDNTAGQETGEPESSQTAGVETTEMESTGDTGTEAESLETTGSTEAETIGTESAGETDAENGSTGAAETPKDGSSQSLDETVTDIGDGKLTQESTGQSALTDSSGAETGSPETETGLGEDGLPLASSADTLEGSLEESSASEGESLSGEPAFYVEIPAQIILNEGRSFTIQTVPAKQVTDGRVLVTVQGTETPDGDSFALYCGKAYWGFQLQIGENLVTPVQNQVELAAEEHSCQAKVVPDQGRSHWAGVYRGNLNFTVTFQPEPE